MSKFIYIALALVFLYLVYKAMRKNSTGFIGKLFGKSNDTQIVNGVETVVPAWQARIDNRTAKAAYKASDPAFKELKKERRRKIIPAILTGGLSNLILG